MGYKWPQTIKDKLKIEFIPFKDSKMIGYVRIENKDTEEFLGTIDDRMSLVGLKKLRRAINGFIRMRISK
jgi:hypothetical protein